MLGRYSRDDIVACDRRTVDADAIISDILVQWYTAQDGLIIYLVTKYKDIISCNFRFSFSVGNYAQYTGYK